MAADARQLEGLLSEAATHADPDARRTAILAIARLHDLAAVPVLLEALRDPDPTVRDHASLGLGALEGRAPPEVAERLLGALAAEEESAVRAHMLDDLGRLGATTTLAALPSALASDEPSEREAACRALGGHALAGRTLPDELLERAASRLADDSSPAVRLACAYALSRATLSPAASLAATRHLVSRARDPDVEVRIFVVRALGRIATSPAETLRDAATDPDWRVAVHALRGLATRTDLVASARAALLQGAFDRALDSDGRIRSGGPLHVLLTAFEMAASDARAEAVFELATALHERLGRLPAGAPPTRDRGLAHCAAAELVDRGRGWPARVAQCGLEQISEAEQRVLEAQILAHVEGAEAQRVVFLRRLTGGEPRVREAALQTAGGIEHPDARAMILDALRTDDDPGVLTTALEAVRAVAVRDARRQMDAVLAGAVGGTASTDPSFVPALRRAGARLRDLDDLEGLVTWAGAVADTNASSLADDLAPLASHRVLAVRVAALAAYDALGLEAPHTTAAETPAIALDDILSGTRRARIETDRGAMIVELDADAAPTTVAAFERLVREHFFDDLTFHRVVAAFVAQGGDPRGDGYGGPGWSQRCEDGRARYVRGTIGMALAGRDTGGSQFFIAHAAQPHLDGRYTAFGRVVDGLDVLDAIQRGDRIRTVTLLEAASE